MELPADLQGVLEADPEVMHGALCFRGTRVPLAVLIDSLEEGVGLDDFLENYPSVSRAQVLAVLSWQQANTRNELGLEDAS